MAIGNYGNIRSADVEPNDMEIYYIYRKTRTSQSEPVGVLNPVQVVKKIKDPNDAASILGGMYEFELPSSIFSRIGYYSIYVRPKKLKLNILDCGVLAVDNSIRGIVLDLSKIPPTDAYKFDNNGLIGSLVEYYSDNPINGEKKIQNLFRIVTSNFKVEPISDNISTVSQKSIKYRANDNATLCFLTLTPSTQAINTPNLVPYIGKTNQTISLSATNFDPFMIEVNIVEHNIDTLAFALYGNRSKSVNEGIETIYDNEGRIFKQFVEYPEQVDANGRLMQIRLQLTNLDTTQNLGTQVPPTV